ncbi:MAG: glycerol-3-phosphate acyltransferase, partial [Planctomycetota bacterium]
MLLISVLLLAAYLVGSVSFAWLAGRLKGVDLRQHGSGNLGATNAGRTLGGAWFAIVFIADVAKGALPVLLVRLLLPIDLVPVELPLLAVLTGAAAVLGHVFTCFHGFRGGKAVATSLGVLIGLVPLVAGLGAGIWLITWLLARKGFGMSSSDAVSPASLLAAAAIAPIQILVHEQAWGRGLPITILVLALSLLVL